MSNGVSRSGLTRQVGKYEIQRLLGKGATGSVFLAVDSFSGKRVALKVLEPEVFRDPEFGAVYRTQFLNEASLAGKLKHPHIVAILDAVVQAEAGHIAMELVSGGDLSQHAKPDRLLPVYDVLQIGFKCCGALEYAFREGIVHRDIKPANIMVATGTNVKISDFGAAFLRKSQAVQSVAMGSPFYMSPEQIQNEPLTHHSDMYSFGVVLYELLTGHRPFTAETLPELVRKILQEPPDPPSRLRPDLPRALDAIVLRVLGKRPEDRYSSWADFGYELSEAVKLVMPPDDVPDSEKFIALKNVNMLAIMNDAEIWELVNAGRWSRVPPRTVIIRENEPGQSFFFLAQGQVMITRQGRLLNIVDAYECVGEMAYIRGGQLPRHATVESVNQLLLAEYEPAALAKISCGAQLQLTRGLVRNLVDRLELANTRIAR